MRLGEGKGRVWREGSGEERGFVSVFFLPVSSCSLSHVPSFVHFSSYQSHWC